jgi:arginine deiminase
MVAPLRRVIVKGPAEAWGSERQIEAQWMALGYSAPPRLQKASEEHEDLVGRLRRSGAEVLFLPADERTGLDSIFPHDPGIVTEAGAVIFQTGKAARRGEGPALADALARWRVPVLGRIEGDATAEGGDMVWLDRKTLLAGRGFRTNGAGIAAIRRILRPLDVEVVEVALPHWTGPADCLHLMSLMSLIDHDLAVVYRKLLPVPLFEVLVQRGIRLVDVPEDEYATLGSNVLAVAPRKVLLLRGNPVTRARLQDAGCEVEEFSGEEISLKGGGGPTCLTRPLWRA